MPKQPASKPSSLSLGQCKTSSGTAAPSRFTPCQRKVMAMLDALPFGELKHGLDEVAETVGVSSRNAILPPSVRQAYQFRVGYNNALYGSRETIAALRAGPDAGREYGAAAKS